MSEGKRTPLYDTHVNLGAKMVEFGGFLMPVQYSGIIEEHNAVRNAAGLFDVSHMGEFEVKGKDAKSFIQKLITNNMEKIEPGKALYTPMCYEDGGTVDDLLVYCYDWDHYWLVVNAANIEKDWQWVNKQIAKEKIEVKNISPEICQLALQGPKAQEILQKLVDLNLAEIKFFRFKTCRLNDIECMVSRTGYTGEDGFEIYLASQDIEKIWNMILEAGKPYGLAPIGLGARDTLRFEAGLALYGHELSQDISPLEAGLGIFVDLKSDNDFIGKEALLKQKSQGLVRKKVGLEMIERGIAREGYVVRQGTEKIGFITSGSYSPTLGKNLALALIETEKCEIGSTLEVMIRNRPCKAVIVKTPFYKKEAK